MSRWSDIGNTTCPIARSLAVVGDRWTLLILRELSFGNGRFEEIQAQTEASSQMVSTRLKRLEADGLVERIRYSEHPPRYEYRLTAKGQDLFPVMMALRAWGETWLKTPDEGVAMRFRHRTCGSEVGLDRVCPSCGAVVSKDELDSEFSARSLDERAKRHADFKAHDA
jgi:DNA-binding HxlR family transcriptional regulator